MRQLVPLAPAWLVCLWLLATSERLWTPLASEVGAREDGLLGGWVLLAVLAVGTLVHGLAPLLGRNLAVSTNSSMLAGLGPSNEAQRAFGRGLVRGVSLLVVYLLVAGFVALELRATT